MLKAKAVSTANIYVPTKRRTTLEPSKVVERIGFPFGSIVEFLTLTGQRRDEVSRMAWHHVDLDRHLWVIPPEHSKNGKPHSVHLSDQAMSVLREVPRTG